MTLHPISSTTDLGAISVDGGDHEFQYMQGGEEPIGADEQKTRMKGGRRKGKGGRRN
jgi:hypothetical protein